ncbi:hypothetical protein [Wolbachia endosymbiont (group A) of Andrena bucephala]|uniref:hypothetical protein n=1 Tax=Wolbachia endosymbiont (group A) of Andrena bucephala TaxID=3066189 RepID=UPI00397A6ED0
MLLSVNSCLSDQILSFTKRVVSIAYGDHVVRYGEVQINDLLSLRQRIKAELKVAGVKRKIVISTNKGII